MEGFQAATRPLPLTKLDLSDSTINDAALGMLLSAIETGRLPALEELKLERNRISDMGVVALSKTIQAGYLSKLLILNLGSNDEIKAKGAVLLAGTVSLYCSSLTYLGFPKLKEPIQIAIKTTLGDRKDLDLHFK